MTGSGASRSVGATDDELTAMGIYGERILPRVMNLACGMAPGNPLRERVCGGLVG